MADTPCSPFLRRLLLGLLRPGPADPQLKHLALADWQIVDAMAAEHRLQPLLYAEWSVAGRKEWVPPAILTGWAGAHRAAAMVALAQKGGMIAAVRMLEKAGLHPITLKGAWLAWHAYANPAQRPMRDIDLLVAEDHALAAWHMLHDAGYAAPSGLPDKDAASRDKHLPPLLAPSGIVFEIHGACWETADQAGHAMPQMRDAVLRARAQVPDPAEGVAYPAPADMLAHLVVHGVYSHWLDAGPLVLVDIDALVHKAPPDWSSFWQEARDQGWQRGAALLFALADQWRRPGLLVHSGCPVLVPQQLLDAAPDLLLQSLERRAGARILARLGRDGVATTVQAKLREAAKDPLRATGLVGRRVRDLLSGLLHAESKTKSREMKHLGNWLFGG